MGHSNKVNGIALNLSSPGRNNPRKKS